MSTLTHTKISRSDRERYLPSCPVIAVISYSGRVQHPLGGDYRRGVLILVTVIDNCFDPRLDDRLGAFVAREKLNVQFRPFQASAPVIQDSVELAVSHIEILRIKSLALSGPGKFIV